MPHAEYRKKHNNYKNMSEKPMINGEKPHSQFLSHLTSYPVVSDSITVYKTNPYGQKSIEIVSVAYDRLGKPFVPYLQGPYSFFAPYIQKADGLADQGLGKVEQTFPIIKEDTEKVRSAALEIAVLPLKLAGEGRDYVFKTYDAEYKKTGGEGIFTAAKAVISTELKLTADILQTVAGFLSSKKEQAKTKMNQAHAHVQQ